MLKYPETIKFTFQVPTSTVSFLGGNETKMLYFELAGLEILNA